MVHSIFMEGKDYDRILQVNHFIKKINGTRDGLGDITNTHKHIETPSNDIAHKYLQPSDKAASTLALELIRQHEPGSITYIALGPLTNFATMMREDPVTCKERLGRVVSMGGALDVPGNTTPVAECETMHRNHYYSVYEKKY